jgi:hypothetical protein
MSIKIKLLPETFLRVDPFGGLYYIVCVGCWQLQFTANKKNPIFFFLNTLLRIEIRQFIKL